MSKYTTGEIAKLCGVTVRTVQYYDTRGILIPNELSEGGRRLYSEDDLNKMKVICFLREIGLPLNSISELFSEKDPESVITILLEQQSEVLKGEIEERQNKLQMLEHLKRELKGTRDFSVNNIGDIAYMMENRKKLRRVRGVMLAVAIIMEIIEIATVIFWIKSGIWWPFAVGMPFVAMGIWISVYYFKSVAYICPQCHKIFKPKFKEAFWANHTPRTRRLKCPECGHKGFCVETYGKDE